ncbi:hypothetical protein AMECASPLE_037017 [Ameca splendens]|uniref:Uncharacterized protein n=1 Tax=Ameca splendens TaxID=208324 RepID=A0ABV0YJY1_9TELE
MMPLAVSKHPLSKESFSSTRVTQGPGQRDLANVSLLANRHNSSTGSESVIRSRDHMHKLSTNESLFVYPVFIHEKGKLRYKHCLTFSLRPAEANCVPESSLQRCCLYEAEWSSFPV